MSRYKKIITGEIETKEIGGTKFLIYPTLTHRAEMLEIFKDAQVESVFKHPDGVEETRKGVFKISRMVDVCTDIVFEGCYNHDEKGQRTAKKSEEMATTRDDIKSIVMDCIFELFMEIAVQIKIIDKTKREELSSQMVIKGDNPN